MASGTRSEVISSFTVIKGSLLAETYEVFRRWNLGLNGASIATSSAAPSAATISMASTPVFTFKTVCSFLHE